jgi:hypothetical protein
LQNILKSWPLLQKILMPILKKKDTDLKVTYSNDFVKIV